MIRRCGLVGNGQNKYGFIGSCLDCSNTVDRDDLLRGVPCAAGHHCWSCDREDAYDDESYDGERSYVIPFVRVCHGSLSTTTGCTHLSYSLEHDNIEPARRRNTADSSFYFLNDDNQRFRIAFLRNLVLEMHAQTAQQIPLVIPACSGRLLGIHRKHSL